MPRYMDESARNVQYLFAITSLAGAAVMIAPAGLAEANVHLGELGTLYLALGTLFVLFAGPVFWAAVVRGQWFFLNEFKRARRRLYLGLLYGLVFASAYTGAIGVFQIALGISVWLGSTGAGFALTTYPDFYRLQSVRMRIADAKDGAVRVVMCERCLTAMLADEEECWRCGYRFDTPTWERRAFTLS